MNYLNLKIFMLFYLQLNKYLFRILIQYLFIDPYPGPNMQNNFLSGLLNCPQEEQVPKRIGNSLITGPRSISL